jgi:hypothetical protein
VHDRNDNDGFWVNAVENTVGKPPQQRPARISVDDLIELWVQGDAIDRC